MVQNQAEEGCERRPTLEGLGAISRATSSIAAREGGGDPSMNAKLALAVDKAKAENMPKDNIERAIKRGTGEIEGADYVETSYEGYGPHGIAFFVEVLTDNTNRSVADIRSAFLESRRQPWHDLGRWPSSLSARVSLKYRGDRYVGRRPVRCSSRMREPTTSSRMTRRIHGHDIRRRLWSGQRSTRLMQRYRH